MSGYSALISLFSKNNALVLNKKQQNNMPGVSTRARFNCGSLRCEWLQHQKEKLLSEDFEEAERGETRSARASSATRNAMKIKGMASLIGSEPPGRYN